MNIKSYIEKRVDIVKGLISDSNVKQHYYRGQLHALGDLGDAPSDIVHLFCEDLLCDSYAESMTSESIVSELNCALYNNGYRSILVDVYFKACKGVKK